MQKLRRLPGEKWGDYRARLGREMESRVARQLKRLERAGIVSNVRQHTNNELEDRFGADFTVGIRQRTGNTIDCRFGITISRRRHALTIQRHPEVFNLHLPPSLNDNQVHERLFLFVATRVSEGSYWVRRRNQQVLIKNMRKTREWL